MGIDSKYGLQFANLALRGATLAAKFLLVFILALYLDPSELGIYGLMVATIAYGMYPLGFDFYTYNIREILSVENEQRGAFLKNQIALHFRLYLIFLPLFLLIFIFDFLPWKYIVYFFLLLLLEHMNQELSRLLVAFSRQLQASLCLFIRQGLWVLVAVTSMYFFTECRSLETVLILWIVGSFLALILGSNTIFQMKMPGWEKKVDWAWIQKGLKIAAPLLVASLSLNAISTIDRYWFSYLQGKEILATYVFFMALCSSLLSFLDAAVFSFSYPKLVSSVSIQDDEQFMFHLNRMTKQTLLLVSLFIMGSLLTIRLIINWVGNSEIYRSNLTIFYIALVSIGIHSLSYIYHYALYAYKKDKIILTGHIATLLIFIVTGTLFSIWNSLYAIPLAVLTSYMFLFFWKYLAYLKYKQK